MSKYAFVAFACIMISIVAALYSNMSILLWGFVGVILIIVASRGIKPSHKIYAALSIALLLQILLVVVAYEGYIQKYGVPYYLGGSDDLVYETWARDAIKMGEVLPWQITSYNRAQGFIWLLSWVMRVSEILGGYHTISFSILNICFLNIIAVMLYRYACDNLEAKKLNPLFIYFGIALFPNNIYVSAHVFRDTLSSLLLIYMLCYGGNLFQKRSKGKNQFIQLVQVILVGYFAYMVRPQNVYYMVAIMVVSYIFGRHNIPNKKTISIILAVIVAITMFSQLDLMKTLSGYNARYNLYNTSGDTGFSGRIFMLPLFPFGLIARIIYGLVYPVPTALLKVFHITSDIDVFMNFLVAIGTVMHIIMLPYLLRGLVLLNKVSVAYSIMFVSILLSTFGFRHYIMISPLAAVIIYSEWQRTCNYTKALCFIVMCFLIVMTACFYLAIA